MMDFVEPICANCYFFYPCPCGECLYGTCGNTKSVFLHEYVCEDMNHCSVYVPMDDDAKRVWERLGAMRNESDEPQAGQLLAG